MSRYFILLTLIQISFDLFIQIVEAFRSKDMDKRLQVLWLLLLLDCSSSYLLLKASIFFFFKCSLLILFFSKWYCKIHYFLLLSLLLSSSTAIAMLFVIFFPAINFLSLWVIYIFSDSFHFLFSSWDAVTWFLRSAYFIICIKVSKLI